MTHPQTEPARYADHNLPCAYSQEDQAKLIVHAVAEKHKMDVATMLRRCHSPLLARPRWEIMARIRTELKWSLPRIGHFMGMHHTSVLYGIRRHEGATSREIKPDRRAAA